jgi:hypothetical protein
VARGSLWARRSGILLGRSPNASASAYPMVPAYRNPAQKSFDGTVGPSRSVSPSIRSLCQAVSASRRAVHGSWTRKGGRGRRKTESVGLWAGRRGGAGVCRCLRRYNGQRLPFRAYAKCAMRSATCALEGDADTFTPALHGGRTRKNVGSGTSVSLIPTRCRVGEKSSGRRRAAKTTGIMA